jgi:hypothetical protein
MAAYRRLLICLPTTGQSVRSATAVAIANVAKTLVEKGVAVDLHNIDSAEIVTARDMFANMVLYSNELDGLLFIDSDMSFDARLVVRMVELGEDVAAAAYVRRTVDLPTLVDVAQKSGNLQHATAVASSFTLKERWKDIAPSAEQKEGFVTMAAVGMGCALISKNALQMMIKGNQVRPRRDLQAGPGNVCYSFFEPITHNDNRLGEDYSFCHRWTAGLNQKLWVCVDEKLGHIGFYSYSAAYTDLSIATKVG